MQKFEQYRSDLAGKIKNLPHLERKKALKDVRETKEYQEADIFYIQNNFREELEFGRQNWERSDVELGEIYQGQKFAGATGKYEVVEIEEELGLLGSVVRDETGKEFFITPKRAKEQSLASLIGDYLTFGNERLKRLHFPEIRLENINGETVALMEYFRGYEELPFERNPKEDFSEDEKAFLQVYNLWIGNWDYKYDHLLVSQDEKDKAIGLIDLEWSFDFKNRKRLETTADKSIFLGDVAPEKIDEYLKKIETLDIADRNKMIKYAVASGFAPDEVIKNILQLFERRDVVRVEEENMEEIYHNLEDFEFEVAA
jgi:hypothetical protein